MTDTTRDTPTTTTDQASSSTTTDQNQSTDQTTNQNSDTGQSDTGQSAGADKGAGKGQKAAPAKDGKTDAGGDPAPWQDGLRDDLKTDPNLRRYKTVDDLAQAYQHQLKRQGVPPERLLVLPTKPEAEDPEGWAAIHKALGVPESGEGYQIELAPEAAEDAGELGKTLRDWGVKAKVSGAQMAATVELLNTLGKEAAEADAAAAKDLAEAADAALKKEWGQAHEGYTRGIGKLILDASGGKLSDAEQADLQQAIASNVTIAKVLAYALDKMGEPQTLDGGDGGRGGGGNRPLTPAAAQAELNALYADPAKMAAINDRKHPQHKSVLERRQELLALARGEQRPDKA